MMHWIFICLDVYRPLLNKLICDFFKNTRVKTRIKKPLSNSRIYMATLDKTTEAHNSPSGATISKYCLLRCLRANSDTAVDKHCLLRFQRAHYIIHPILRNNSIWSKTIIKILPYHLGYFNQPLISPLVV